VSRSATVGFRGTQREANRIEPVPDQPFDEHDEIVGVTLVREDLRQIHVLLNAMYPIADHSDAPSLCA